jgi:hypothetical protein
MGISDVFEGNAEAGYAISTAPAMPQKIWHNERFITPEKHNSARKNTNPESRKSC